MSTDPTIQPIEAFRDARSAILETVLGAVSGLEGSVLDYEHEHQRRLSAAQHQAAQAQAEVRRYQELTSRQALELQAAAAHVCTPGPTSAETPEEEPAAEAPQQAPVSDAASEEAESEIGRLRGELADAQETIRGLREDLGSASEKAERLELQLATGDGRVEALQAEHAQQLAAIATGFEDRVAENRRAARLTARAEAAGIVEAIAADSPALPVAQAAELFAEAFDVAGEDEAPAAVQEPVLHADETWDAPTEPAQAPEPVVAPVAEPLPDEDFFAEPAPAPMTQAMPDLTAPHGAHQDEDPFGEDEPFFDEAPAALPEPVPAAPKPSFSLFGRKKEETPA